MRYIVMLEMEKEDFESFKWNAHDWIPGLTDWEFIEEYGEEEEE